MQSESSKIVFFAGTVSVSCNFNFNNGPTGGGGSGLGMGGSFSDVESARIGSTIGGIYGDNAKNVSMAIGQNCWKY